MKQILIDNLKNVPGWKTKRKLVVIAVDDYGNVRLDSRQARKNLETAGIGLRNHFDAYDSLETREDLEALFDVLTSVRDRNSRHAVFTPYALPCNIDFEAMTRESYARYIPRTVSQTFEKQAARYPTAYEGTWELMQEGIQQGLMAPQYHGREHLNLTVLEDKLKHQDEDVLTALQNHSYTSISSNGSAHYGYTAAFGFQKDGELNRLLEILTDGLRLFQQEYGIHSVSFTPPAGEFSPLLERTLASVGVKILNRSLIQKQYLGNGKFRREWNFTGKHRNHGLRTLVRNVVFEPTAHGAEKSVKIALSQIKAAFRWNRPAIISSHRVNFCGFIEESNRQKGLKALQLLLNEIVQRWPDVEFVSVEELGLVEIKN